MMRVNYTLPELVHIRASIGSEIDILDLELDDVKNKEDLSIPRGEMLKKHAELLTLLEKTNRAIRDFK